MLFGGMLSRFLDKVAPSPSVSTCVKIDFVVDEGGVIVPQDEVEDRTTGSFSLACADMSFFGLEKALGGSMMMTSTWSKARSTRG